MRFVVFGAGSPEADNLFSTPHKHLGLMDIHQSFAHSLSLSDDRRPEHSSQISPASVLPHHELPLKASIPLHAISSNMHVAIHQCGCQVHAHVFLRILRVMLCDQHSLPTLLSACCTIRWKLSHLCSLYKTGIKLEVNISQCLQTYKGGDPNDQVAEFQNLRHQHAQLLAFNHVLVEENNHRLVDRAELVTEVIVSNANSVCMYH